MSHEILVKFACLLLIIGIFFVFMSFRTPKEKKDRKKHVLMAAIGVILSLVAGLIIICFYYAQQPVSERILKLYSENKYIEK